ncbi:MAG: LCP family protein [bacterium]
MPEEYINFLNEEELFRKKFKRKKTAKIAMTLCVVFTTVALVYSLNALLVKTSSARSANSNTGENDNFFAHYIFNSLKKINILDQLGNFIEIKSKSLKGEEDDRINILILGVGGGNHEGPQLADTIMLASLKPSTKQASLISIPRDLYVPIKDYGWYRINSANAFGEQSGEGKGVELTREVVENITGQSINYFVRIDFDGFEKLIDAVGGICLNVENNLIDYQYPIRGKECAYPISSRYEYLNIEKGDKCMDGSLALKYARSRHSLGVEGNDFARARRQQNVLTALKEKIVSFKTLLNPQRIIKIIDNLKDNLKTDLSVAEILKLANLSKDIEMNKVAKKVLDNSPEGLLIDHYIAVEDGVNMYVLQTKSGDFHAIKNLAENIFSETDVLAETADAAKETAEIEIMNGTKIPGLAYQASMDLKSNNFNIAKVGNAEKQNFTKTIIYTLESDKFKNTISFLQKELDADVLFNYPVWMQESTASSTADIVIVLGKEG